MADHRPVRRREAADGARERRGAGVQRVHTLLEQPRDARGQTRHPRRVLRPRFEMIRQVYGHLAIQRVAPGAAGEQRLDLDPIPNPERADALRAQQRLVPGDRDQVHVPGPDVDWQVPRGLRHIHEHARTRGAGQCGEPRHVERRAEHIGSRVDREQGRAIQRALERARFQLPLCRAGHHAHVYSGTRGQAMRRAQDGVVVEAGHDQHIAATQHAVQRGVRGMGRVEHERDAARVAGHAEQASQQLAAAQRDSPGGNGQTMTAAPGRGTDGRHVFGNRTDHHVRAQRGRGREVEVGDVAAFRHRPPAR